MHMNLLLPESLSLLVLLLCVSFPCKPFCLGFSPFRSTQWSLASIGCMAILHLVLLESSGFAKANGLKHVVLGIPALVSSIIVQAPKGRMDAFFSYLSPGLDTWARLIDNE